VSAGKISTSNLHQLRVLHVVGTEAVNDGMRQQLLMPLLTRMPRDRIKAQVVSLAPGMLPAVVLRQHQVPVHDVALSRRRFSLWGFHHMMGTVKQFRPDVIHAWGYTAQLLSLLAARQCDWKPRVVWSIPGTASLPRHAGAFDRWKLKCVARLSGRVDRIVYASEAGAAQHRRAGFPDGGHLIVPPGVDAVRFKPDIEARNRLREQLQIDPTAFVIGMSAPFQPQSDHATFLKAIADLVKTQPHVVVILAGHGVQKSNAALMALLGSGSLAIRTHLLGEWSDVASLYNTCDVVCSSAVHDGARMQLVMAMLCGVPCVATGMGAQGEVLGQFGIAIEPGSPPAFVKGLGRLMQLTPQKRLQLLHGARKHALQHYIHVRSLQKQLQLYYDLVGRDARGSEDVPAPRIDAGVPVPAPTAKTRPVTTVIDISAASDPDSLESRVVPAEEPLPKWRVEQEIQRARQEAAVTRPLAAHEGPDDVLQVFEAKLAEQTEGCQSSDSPLSERARGVAEEVGDLLAPEMLEMLVSDPVADPRGPVPDTGQDDASIRLRTATAASATGP